MRPKEVHSHLKSAHPIAGFTIDDVQLEQAIEDLDIAPDFPIMSGTDYDEFAGLNLSQGIYCMHCSKVMGTTGSASTHYSNVHRGTAKPKNLPTGYYQQLRTGQDRGLFRVKPRARNAISADQTLVESLRAETDKAFTEAMGVSHLNARAVAPWLLTSKWHVHADGYDPAELMALVKPLTKRENFTLVQLVDRYFRDATDLIDHTDELILQHLNTPDPTKTYVVVNWLGLT